MEDMFKRSEFKPKMHYSDDSASSDLRKLKKRFNTPAMRHESNGDPNESDPFDSSSNSASSNFSSLNSSHNDREFDLQTFIELQQDVLILKRSLFPNVFDNKRQRRRFFSNIWNKNS